jgi:hypothetical protein
MMMADPLYFDAAFSQTLLATILTAAASGFGLSASLFWLSLKD